MYTLILIILIALIALLISVATVMYLSVQNVKLKNKIKSMEQEPTKHIGYNVEQMTINMSGGTFVQHADLVQASGDVLVDRPDNGAKNKPAKNTYQPPIPKEGEGYNAVREYIAERKKYDETFRIYWDGHNLKQNCEFLTKEFGWIVDDHSLGTNINRHR